LLTGQLADKPIHGQTSRDWITRGLVNSPTANLKKSWNYYTLFVR